MNTIGDVIPRATNIHGNKPDTWGEGCEQCSYGLINPPETRSALTSGIPHYIVRAYETAGEVLLFCTCPAGVNYRRQMQKILRNIHDKTDYVPLTWSERIDAHVAAQKMDVQVPTAKSHGVYK